MKNENVNNVFIVHKHSDGRCKVCINGRELPCVKDFSYKKTSVGSSTEVVVTFDADVLIDDFNEKVF